MRTGLLLLKNALDFLVVRSSLPSHLTMEQKFGVVAGNTCIRRGVTAQPLCLKLKLDLESVGIQEDSELVGIEEAAGEPPVVAGREGMRHRVTECQLERKPKPVCKNGTGDHF